MKRMVKIIILSLLAVSALAGCSDASSLSYIENEIDRSYSSNTLDKIFDQLDEAYDPLKDELDYIYGVLDSAMY